MNLCEQGAAPGREALDHPQLPERTLAVEGLCEQPLNELLQSAFAARFRQRVVQHVQREVEMRVVDPHRVLIDRHEREPLTRARYEVESGRDQRTNPREIDAAVRASQWLRVEEAERGDVLRRARPLEIEEQAIARREPLREGLHAAEDRRLARAASERVAGGRCAPAG